MGECKSSNLTQYVKIHCHEVINYNDSSIWGDHFLSGCSVYRQGQTPDDVYYSPAREASQEAEDMFQQIAAVMMDDVIKTTNPAIMVTTILQQWMTAG